jgi:hypothetical protein
MSPTLEKECAAFAHQLVFQGVGRRLKQAILQLVSRQTGFQHGNGMICVWQVDISVGETVGYWSNAVVE